jgi:signal peptidase I
MIKFFLISLVTLFYIVLLTACNNNETPVQETTTLDTSQNCSTPKTVTVRGTSMHGIVNNNDDLILQQGYYNCHPVKFKDIIVFEYNQKELIKTIYGLPGDIISYANNYLLINNKKIQNHKGEWYQVDEVGKSYVRLMQQTIMQNSIIPRGHFWVLGTAKMSGYDSRRIGLVPMQSIVGKIQTQHL